MPNQCDKCRHQFSVKLNRFMRCCLKYFTLYLRLLSNSQDTVNNTVWVSEKIAAFTLDIQHTSVKCITNEISKYIMVYYCLLALYYSLLKNNLNY